MPGFVPSWVNGDFNYDNHIDGADYALIDTAFAFSGGAAVPPTGVDPGQFTTRRGPAAVIGSLPTAVPEPCAFGMLMVGGALLGLRRRRSAGKAIAKI